VCLCIALLSPVAHGQAGLEITRFIPGDYLANNLHEVELYNGTGRTILLDQYYLVTRDYTLRFPSGTRLYPGTTYRMAKYKRGKPNIDLELGQAPDFLIRFYEKKVEGNLVALLNARLQPISAFYHCQRPDAPFLPDSGRFILGNRTVIPYRLPGYAHPVWGYFPLGEDPAIGFERIRGEWRVISATQDLNLYPVTAFIDFKARYQDEVVTLKWNTAFEDQLTRIEIQRSANRSTFRTIAKLDAQKGKTQQVTGYTYPDSQLPGQDSIWYYRLQAQDRDGRLIESKVVQVVTREVPVPFWLEVYPARTQLPKEVGIRFSSAYSQEVNIALLSAEGQLIHLLFQGPVFATVQNLLELTTDIAEGTYWIVASTEEGRFYKKLRVTAPQP
jgi:hypothetical protein